MNSNMKLLKCLSVEFQNFGLLNPKSPEQILTSYMGFTDEQIEIIYNKYHGEEKEEEEMVLMIVGEFEFNVHEKSPEEYSSETHLIHRIDMLKFVELEKSGEIGEKHLTEGYDAYMILNDYDPNTILCSTEWFSRDDEGGVVVFDKHMQLIVGFDHGTDVYANYRHAKEVGSKLIKLNNNEAQHPPRYKFKWKYYDMKNPYGKEPVQEEPPQETVRPSISTLEEHKTVISSMTIEKALRDEKTDWDVDAFCDWFDGKDIIWIGDCDGFNFDELPEEIQELLKRRLADGGYYGIYYDY